MTQLLAPGIDKNQVTTQTTSEIISSKQPTIQAWNYLIWFKSCIKPESSEMTPFSYRSRKSDEQPHEPQLLKRQTQGCKPANRTSANSSPLTTLLQRGPHQHPHQRRVTSPDGPPTRSGLCDPRTARERCYPSIVLHDVGLTWPWYSEATYCSAGSERRKASVTKAPREADRGDVRTTDQGAPWPLGWSPLHFSLFIGFWDCFGVSGFVGLYGFTKKNKSM